MNLYSLFLGEASYLRKEMQDRYRHSRHESLRVWPNEPSHEFSLYGALNTWRLEHNNYHCDMGLRLRLIFAEVAPFEAMEEGVSLEALAEYGVYLNLPAKARTAWLAEKISVALTQPLNGHILSIVDQGEQDRIGWWGLVGPEVK